jgi:hypothetical protein
MNSPTEQRLGAALHDLVADQPFTPDPAAIEHRARQDRQRRRIITGSAGVVAVAAVAAVGTAVAIPSGSASPAQAGAAHSAAGASGAHQSTATRSKAAASKTPAAPLSAQQTLVQTANLLAASPHPKGDATLFERETAYPGKASINVWDLYADNAKYYYFSQTKSGLPAQVRDNNTQGGGLFAAEVAAATYAENGNLDTAALKMAWAGSTGPVPAWIKAQLKDISKGNLQIDNYVWENSEDALVTGAGDPKVEAGVLRLVSILPDITVTHGTLDGQPTLTITAGQEEFANSNIPGDTGTGYQEAMTINTDTGMPVHMVGGTSADAMVTVTYVATRVSLADIAAGKV